MFVEKIYLEFTILLSHKHENRNFRLCFLLVFFIEHIIAHLVPAHMPNFSILLLCLNFRIGRTLLEPSSFFHLDSFNMNKLMQPIKQNSPESTTAIPNTTKAFTKFHTEVLIVSCYVTATHCCNTFFFWCILTLGIATNGFWRTTRYCSRVTAHLIIIVCWCGTTTAILMRWRFNIEYWAFRFKIWVNLNCKNIQWKFIGRVKVIFIATLFNKKKISQHFSNPSLH